MVCNSEFVGRDTKRVLGLNGDIHLEDGLDQTKGCRAGQGS